MRLVTGLMTLTALVLGGCDWMGRGDGKAAEGDGDAAVAETPEQFIGVWAADCERPYVRFAEHEIQVYNDGQTYPITAVSYDGQALVVAYQTGNGPIEETYVVDGETIQMTSGVYDGTVIPASQPPMERCD